MQTYHLVDTQRRREIVDSQTTPGDLDFDLVRNSSRWDVVFKTEPLDVPGPFTPIASVDYFGHAAENHEWVAKLVAKDLRRAYEAGALEPYLRNGPIVTIGGPVYAQIPISHFGVKALRPLYRAADECEHCGHLPCGCGG